MGLVISEQCLCLLYAVVLGLALGLSYEILRILRAFVPHNALFIGIEDFFFCLYCTFCIILLCYSYSDGYIRWYAIFGICLGVFFYFLTLGRLLQSLTQKAVVTLERFCRKVYKTVLWPIACKLGSLKKSLSEKRNRQKAHNLLRKQTHKDEQTKQKLRKIFLR